MWIFLGCRAHPWPSISDVLAVDEILQPILDSRLGDVFTVDDIVLRQASILVDGAEFKKFIA